MKRPQLEDVSPLYSEIFLWIRDHLQSDQEAQALTNQIHYLAQRHAKKYFATGILLGLVSMGILLKWLA